MRQSSGPIEVLCRYRVKPGKDGEFEDLLRRHWRVLRDVGLTTREPARILRGADQDGNVAYVERFAWRDEGAVESAHDSPQVMELWEPMGSLCTDMEFWHVEPVEL